MSNVKRVAGRWRLIEWRASALARRAGLAGLAAVPLAVLAALAASPAQAHVPEVALSGGQSGGRPWFVATLLVAAVVLYGAGLARIWPHSHEHRGLALRAAAFFVGCGSLALLLLGPLDAFAPRSFALHMLQHEGLMLIAAPLLVLGRALPLFLWALPHAPRVACGRVFHSTGLRRGWGVLTAPLSAWLLHALALWVWHAPVLFDAALRDPALHEWQHVTFLLTALLFWHAVLRRGSAGAQGMSVLYLLTTTIHTGVLGALLALARRPLYASMTGDFVPYLGLTPLEDQQLGGLIMWVPGALVYVGVALWVMARWIGIKGTEDISPKSPLSPFT
jgi:putative membrane protein